jgi:hypothetical protein
MHHTAPALASPSRSATLSRPLRLTRRRAFALLALFLGVGTFTREVEPAPELWWSSRGRSEPLTAAEEASPAAAQVTRLFNPAMAFADPGLWPVDVRYAWSDGADVVARVKNPSGSRAYEYVAVPHADIERRSWADLPSHDPAGRPIRYGVDAPGDDHVSGGRTRWRERWDALVAPSSKASTPDAAATTAFPPTQYAHVFWFNRAEGLLAIQYWFYYPFNEWLNHHEGDWEHVTIILEGPRTLSAAARFRPVGYQFAFHSWTLETESVVRVGGAEPAEDHLVVFVGGRGRLLWWQGTASGASYPLPALYPGVGSGPSSPGEDTRSPQRFIGARDFTLVQLPEPERLDSRAHPELSWLRLPFYAGQERVTGNPPLVDRLGGGGPPVQPAQRTTWNARSASRAWSHEATIDARSLPLPGDWPLLSAPWARRLASAAAVTSAR